MACSTDSIKRALAIERKESDEILTPEQAATMLGLKTQTLAVWRSVDRYKLPFLKIGSKTVRYRRSDVQAFLNQAVVGSDAG